MPTIQPSVSPEVKDTLIRVMKLHQFVLQTVPQDLIHDADRKILFSAYFAIADDFFGSIITLIDRGGSSDGSAVALLRPLLDVAVRAQWVYFCASESNVTRIHAGDPVSVFPGLEAMIDSLEKYVGEDIYEGWREILKNLHGFTHGGFEQLMRSFDAAGNLKSSYNDELKIGTLIAATLQYSLMASLFCKVHYDGQPQDDPKTLLIEEKAMELFPPE